MCVCVCVYVKEGGIKVCVITITTPTVQERHYHHNKKTKKKLTYSLNRTHSLTHSPVNFEIVSEIWTTMTGGIERRGELSVCGISGGG